MKLHLLSAIFLKGGGCHITFLDTKVIGIFADNELKGVIVIHLSSKGMTKEVFKSSQIRKIEMSL